MARTASPWFWEERQGWYVNKDGQRHFLGEQPQGAPPPRKITKKWNAPASILQAFHALMADPAMQEKFGKAGRKRAEEKFSWSAIAQETADLYKNLIARK